MWLYIKSKLYSDDTCNILYTGKTLGAIIYVRQIEIPNKLCNGKNFKKFMRK